MPHHAPPAPGFPSPPLSRLFVVAALVSVAAWAAAERFAPSPVVPWTPQMRSAAERMAAAEAAVRSYRESHGLPLDAASDPNGTGLIGPEYGELFTTLGDLEAKRTATNPDAAALVGHLLERAGVGSGDTVAIAASGSFPALVVAALAATEALGASPVTVLSVGASSYGATDPRLDLLAIHQLLLERGLVRTPPAAVALGGTRDAGEEWEPEVRERALARLAASGLPVIREADLASSVARRMEVYGCGGAGASAGGPGGASCTPAAFVNVGGADANIGTSPTLLSIRPGLHDPGDIPLPPAAQRGVLQEMAAAGVPVIHLLDLKGLAGRYGLPWDPMPLPAPGTTRLVRDEGGRPAVLAAIAGGWLAAMVILAVAGVRLRRRSRQTPTLP